MDFDICYHCQFPFRQIEGEKHSSLCHICKKDYTMDSRNCSHCGGSFVPRAGELKALCSTCAALPEAKLPLGVMPRKIWLEKRIEDLTRAIHEYAQTSDWNPLLAWTIELEELLNQHESESKP